MTTTARAGATTAPAAGPTVTGPHPIYVRPIPAGAVLDVEAYATALVLYLAREEVDALAEIADAYDANRPHDGHRPEAFLVEQLVARISTDLPVYGGQVLQLAERLRQIGEQLPGQGGTAA
ncbi:hypothetical protein AB0M28_13665 [Streptomyces sp. NPDC051940]|uniref:hypothetical protein n=1 Tax=Streptomyces sp. NPDC051940 TaxID=3155675 RepID=UPI00343297FB